MATIRNYRDQVLQSTSTRLIPVPSNGITLVGTGNIFENKGSTTYPPTITVRAIPFGHLTNLPCTFSLVATTGHTLSVVATNVALITGDIDGSSIITLRASITYQGLSYESTYTINLLQSTNISLYSLITLGSYWTYDSVSDTYGPNIFNTTVKQSVDGEEYTDITSISYYFFFASRNGGATWETYSFYYESGSSSNGVIIPNTIMSYATDPQTITHVKIGIHTEWDNWPSSTTFLTEKIIVILKDAYSGTTSPIAIEDRFSWGKFGRRVALQSYPWFWKYTGGVLSGSQLGTTSFYVSHYDYGYEGTIWNRWLLDGVQVKDWSQDTSGYSGSAMYLESLMPMSVTIETCEGAYCGSNVIAATTIRLHSMNIDSTEAQLMMSNEYPVVSGYLDTNNLVDPDGAYYSNADFYVYQGSSFLSAFYNGSYASYNPNWDKEYPPPGNPGKYTAGDLQDINCTTLLPDITYPITTMEGTLANRVLTVRARNWNDTEATVLVQQQLIFKSSVQGLVAIISKTFAESMGLIFNDIGPDTSSETVNFTNIAPEFWSGSVYSPAIFSNGVYITSNFDGQTIDTSYAGDETYSVTVGEPTNPLTPNTYTGSSSVGTATEYLDHPAVFGIGSY